MENFIFYAMLLALFLEVFCQNLFPQKFLHDFFGDAIN